MGALRKKWRITNWYPKPQTRTTAIAVLVLKLSRRNKIAIYYALLFFFVRCLHLLSAPFMALYLVELPCRLDRCTIVSRWCGLHRWKKRWNMCVLWNHFLLCIFLMVLEITKQITSKHVTAHIMSHSSVIQWMKNWMLFWGVFFSGIISVTKLLMMFTFKIVYITERNKLRKVQPLCSKGTKFFDNIKEKFQHQKHWK